LRREVAALTAQGITRIIAVTHLGFAEDRALAAAVDDVDVYVGGHSHTLLHNSDPAADGPSPVVVRQPSGRPSLIVQTGFGGRYLGRLQVSFDAQGVPVRWQGEPLALDRAVAADPTALAFVEALAQPLAAFHREPVATATVALEGGRQACRAGECLLGDLIAEALLWSTRSQGTRVAILNGGGIRASLPAGPITVGQILEVLPFSNTIATLELTGADLRAALEFGVARAEDQGNDGTGRFPQVAGLRFVWDAAAPAGQRIVSVTVAGADGSAQPLDPAAVYEVATHDYLRQGGDGYTIFRDRARNPYDGGATLEDAFAAYLSAHDPVAPALDGRIRRLN
jgi:5'-nucleotidase